MKAVHIIDLQALLHGHGFGDLWGREVVGGRPWSFIVGNMFVVIGGGSSLVHMSGLFHAGLQS